MTTYNFKKSHFWPSPFYLGLLANLPQLFKKKMVKKFKFDPSCAYNLNDPVNQTDINKLFGWSQGYHEINSCRIGWCWNLKKMKMEVHAYCHVKGSATKFIDQLLCDVDLDKWYVGEIWIDGGKYFFRISDAGNPLGYAEIQSNYALNVGYMLKPYFGGELPASQDMKLFLENA